MSLRSNLLLLTRVIALAAFVSTTYLYLFPFWSGCAFPSTTGSIYDGFKDTIARHTGLTEPDDTQAAPFRLLVLADPQLEGDSSLPDPEDAILAKLRSHWGRLQQTELSTLTSTLFEVAKEFMFDDIARALWATRKTLDLFGNDYYLAHIYRTLHWWTRPTHVTVLGDLIGSQWVSDDEFEWRGWRYWNRVFAGSRPVEPSYMTMHEQQADAQQAISLDPSVSDWSRQVINIAGNHDIGYAGDISPSRVDRFEHTFGKVNWDINFAYPPDLIPTDYTNVEPLTLHLIILNSMLLDTPALNSTLQQDTYSYINSLITSRLSGVDETQNNSFTLLLTHVPLHKPAGICIDAPFFDFWDFTDADGQFENGGLKEQNHLSQHVSEQGILQAILGKSGNLDATMGGVGRRGLILNGHDHEGCDVVHYVERYNATPAVEERTASAESADEGPWQDEDFLLTDQVNSSSSDPQFPTDESEEYQTSSSDDSPEASTIDPSDPLPDVSSSISTTTTPSEPTPTWRWKSMRTSKYPPSRDASSSSTPSTPDLSIALREITLRSMMGSYGGNTGLLSLWFNFDKRIWEYEMVMCPAGVQHIWWGVHVIDMIAILASLAWVVEWMVGRRRRRVVVKRVRMTSYVRERPRRAVGEHAQTGGSGAEVKQVKRVEEIKTGIKQQATGRRGGRGGAERDKKRVYRNVVG